MDQVIVFNPARQPIFFTGVHPFHTHDSSLTSQKQHIVTTPRRVRGDNQVTLNALAGCQPFMQNAIEAAAAQIPGFTPERAPGA
ncbi:MAG: hypothetical protein ABSF25_16165 [Bryobacteraceae bacterium]|jgi:hypothetical protein